ncbi:MAG: type II toxin-antitoxin system VapC family toxin [Acidobacteriota bacterium]
MLYFDTAYIAKCYLNEPGAASVRHIAYSSSGIASCELARVEFHVTVHRHLRESHLTADRARRAVEDFLMDEADGVWCWFPATSSLLEQICDRIKLLPPGVFLRTVDAIHLTCASSNGFQAIYSNDRHLLAAAPYFGLTGINII